MVEIKNFTMEYTQGVKAVDNLSLTIEDGDVFGLSEEVRTRRITRYADMFEITSSLGDVISSYSHGMKQKVAIIGALIHEPKFFVLDEPFVGLDPKATLTLKNIMHERCKEGCSVFFSTHVLDVAEKLCNKVAIIKKGSLVATGTMEEIKGNKSLEDVFMEVEGELWGNWLYF